MSEARVRRGWWIRHAGGSLAAVLLLAAIPLVGAGLLGLRAPFALAVPALALAFFVVGASLRVARWMRAPVPFRIPVTTGQQAFLPWIRRSRLGSPRGALDAIARVGVDVLLFRPLLRRAPTVPAGHGELGADRVPWLWLLAALFHGSLAVIALRHLCLFVTPVPTWLATLAAADAWLELGTPRLHLTGAALLVAIAGLLARRLLLPRLRYVSLAADYFPLWLLAAIGGTGLMMRHFTGVDLVAVRTLLRTSASLAAVVPPELDPIFLLHLFLVGVLLVYFPLSKLMHLPGALMSPTLGLGNTNREVRHVNPHNPRVEPRSYAEYEAEFRERMVEAGLPVTEE